jgi:hypothetical protein
MYKKKWLYWPLFLGLILAFMITTAPYKRTHVKGPFISWKSPEKLEFVYVHLDTVRRITVAAGSESSFAIAGRLSDHKQLYQIHKNPQPLPEEIQNLDSILIIGQTNGAYWKLNRYLQSNKVIDADGHWTWGKGHLVFTGNIIGNNNQLTQHLWLLYKLEHEAAAAGGGVHFLLGEHEVMLAQGNFQPINKDEIAFLKTRNVSYTDQFNGQSVFGQWIRSRHTALRLNNLLIAYAGISPSFAENGSSLPQLNQQVRAALLQPATEAHPSLFPHVKPGHNNLQQQYIDRLLEQYKATHLITANVIQDSIITDLNGKVVSVSVNTDDWQQPMEGLLYRNGKLARLKQGGTIADL